MKAQRQYVEMKSIMKAIGLMMQQPTTDKLSAYMGAAMKETELAKHLTYGQRATLERLISEIYKELREEAIDTDAYIENKAPVGFLELLLGC